MTTIPFIIPPAGAPPNAHENALLESKRFLQSTLDALSSHIAILDEQGTIIEVNAAWIRFACKNEFMGGRYGVGDNYLKVCDSASGNCSEGASAVAAGIRAVMAGQCSEFLLEYPCHSPHEQRWFVVRATRFGGDGPIRVVVAQENITERKQAEEAFQESEERFSGAFEYAPIGVCLVSPEGRLIKVNRALCELVGYSATELLTCSFQELTHPEDLAADLENVRRLLAGEIRSYQMEKRYIHARGHFVNALLSVSLVCDVHGQPHYFISQIQDITERKHAALQLVEHEEREAISRRALEHERELNQTKSRFVSLVSHEFRTPLCIIGMAGCMLGRYLDRMTPNEKSRQIEGIQSAVDRMTRMMEDLLIHGEFEAGKMECKPALMDVEALCRRAVSEAISQAGTPRSIQCVFDPAVREAVIDAKILRHILSNLLSNAIKYSSADQPVTLEVKQFAGTGQTDDDAPKPEEDCLQFKVSDSGIGIPAADLAMLFQTFQRASNVGNRPGTGMGLAIVKQFVDLHRGAIRAESVEGRGTTFRVWLPIVSPGTAKGD